MASTFFGRFRGRSDAESSPEPSWRRTAAYYCSAFGTFLGRTVDDAELSAVEWAFDTDIVEKEHLQQERHRRRNRYRAVVFAARDYVDNPDHDTTKQRFSVLVHAVGNLTPDDLAEDEPGVFIV